MRTLYLTLLFCLGLGSLSAQNHVQAKKLLQEASAKMRSYPQIKMSFSYEFENRRVDPPLKQSQQGTIAVQGDNYRLELGGIEQLRSGNKMYTILHEDEEVQISTYDEEEDPGLTPGKLLSSFEKGYSYKMGGTETINGKSISYIILKPNASEEVDKIMVGIETATKHIYSMQQWGTNGTLTTLKVQNFIAKPQLPASHFRYNPAKYADYYISE